ncbi:uncharacterized protein LOC144439386 [Glandiceps talaboti]
MTVVLSMVLLYLNTGQDSKIIKKSSTLWGNLPSSLVRVLTRVRYRCKHQLLIKQSSNDILWQVCRDMEQGIKLDTPKYNECIISAVTSSSFKNDKMLVDNFKMVFDRCQIRQIEAAEVGKNLFAFLSTNIRDDIELLKLDIGQSSLQLFHEGLSSGLFDNIRQLLLKMDIVYDGQSYHLLKPEDIRRIENVFRRLEGAGFSLTFSNFIPLKYGNGIKTPLCCFYSTWVKLHKDTQSPVELKPKILEWQPEMQLSADGRNKTFQTSFQMQPWAGDKINGSWDDEIRRLLMYMKTNPTHCKKSQHMGNDLDEDGGWDICFDPGVGLDTDGCLVYSIGIGEDWSFDEAMAGYGCDVFSFDPSIHQPSHKHSEKVWFHSFGLMDRNTDKYYGRGMDAFTSEQWKVRTLEGLMGEMDHQHYKIDILKMDIEGAEWQVLSQLLAKGTLQYVKLLVFEVHLWRPTYEEEKEDFRQKYSTLKWLEQQGFKQWHWHENLQSVQIKLGENYFQAEPCCYELAWINTRFTDWWGSHSNKKILNR